MTYNWEYKYYKQLTLFAIWYKTQERNIEERMIPETTASCPLGVILTALLPILVKHVNRNCSCAWNSMPCFYLSFLHSLCVQKYSHMAHWRLPLLLRQSYFGFQQAVGCLFHVSNWVEENMTVIDSKLCIYLYQSPILTDKYCKESYVLLLQKIK